MDFVDKVRVVVEKKTEDSKTRENIIINIAKTNANKACMKVIMALPFEPRPTLTQMIQACTRLVQVNNSVSNSVPKKQGGVIGGVEQETAAVEEVSPLFCYRCGGKEHTSRFCRAPAHMIKPPPAKPVSVSPDQQRQGN